MVARVFKITGIWLAMVVVAIFNGLLRDTLLVAAFGAYALPISGVLLAALILLVVYLLIPLLGRLNQPVCLAIGIYWLALTLAFELSFGYVVAGKPWQEIVQVFNISSGNLFVVALSATLVAPWFAAKLRGLV